MRAIPIEIGSRYGRLVVCKSIRLWDKAINGRRLYWVCSCDCGKRIKLPAHSLNSGRQVSCGCYGKEMWPQASKTHGMSKTAEFKVWQDMIVRCSNKGDKNYRGRGIRVCKRWKESFLNFLADVGPRPVGNKRYSIERIDNNGHYKPGNVKWATCKEQCRNTRQNRKFTVNGVTKLICEWSELTGISHATLRHRINVGWKPEDVVSKPSLRSKFKQKTVVEACDNPW